MLFDTFAADFRMVHTRVVALECVSILTTPLLGHFLVAGHKADEHWSKQVAACLEDICGGQPRRPVRPSASVTLAMRSVAGRV